MTEVEALYGNDGTVHETDDGLRRDSKPEKLGTLKPFFDRKVGLVTPGNSSLLSGGVISRPLLTMNRLLAVPSSAAPSRMSMASSAPFCSSWPS